MRSGLLLPHSTLRTDECAGWLIRSNFADDLQREILQERPELSRMAATLKSTSVAKSQIPQRPPHRPAPLPDPPAMAQQAAHWLGPQQLGAQCISAQRPRPDRVGCLPQPGSAQHGCGSGQRVDGCGYQQGALARPSSSQQIGGMAIGQYARVCPQIKGQKPWPAEFIPLTLTPGVLKISSYALICFLYLARLPLS